MEKMIHTLAIKSIFEKEKKKVKNKYTHFGLTPLQKTDKLIFLFGKEKAIEYVNERIKWHFGSSLKDRLDYWKEVKQRIENL